MKASRLILLFACVTATIAAMPASAEERYAFVVGVEDYLPEFFRNLDYAEEDAVQITEKLRELGYHVISLTAREDNPGRKPSDAGTILRALDGRLKGINKDDVLLVMMTGHGVQFADDPKLPDGSRESYFCPEQARLDDKTTLLPISKELLSRIKARPAERKLVLLDACRNEVLSPAGDKSVSIKLESVHENLRTVPRGMSVLFSCSSGQKSWEHQDLEHSVFSNYVLEYLSGKASRDLYDEGSADIDGLVTYVRRHTHRYVLDHISPSGQRPDLIGDRTSWHLGELGGRRVLLQRIRRNIAKAREEGTLSMRDCDIASVIADPLFIGEPVDEQPR